MPKFVELWVYLSATPLFGLTATLVVYGKRTANPSCPVAPGQLEVGATQRCGNNSSKREFGQVGNLVSTSFR